MEALFVQSMRELEEPITNVTASFQKMLWLSERYGENIIAANKQVHKTKNIRKRQKKARTFFTRVIYLIQQRSRLTSGEQGGRG